MQLPTRAPAPRPLRRQTTATIRLALGFLVFTAAASAPAAVQSRELKVAGNQIVLADDTRAVVHLTGLNVPGCEWAANPADERVARSIKEAMENWHSNLIRLPVSVAGWQRDDYKKQIDGFIQMVAEAGNYVVLDLHHYKQFDDPRYLDFWHEAAAKHKNHPAVLFGILNEPHDTTWEVWRNGDGAGIAGHQQVVELIRDLGARNIIIAGGLDWGYDLTGVAGDYALVDQGSGGARGKKGNGIVYDTHIYPWKGGREKWDAKVAAVRRRHPILVGENGFDPGDVTQQKFAPDARHETWVPELFAWKNDAATYGNRAHWTGWCFHYKATPVILSGTVGEFRDDANYAYPATPFWGVYVKTQLEAALGINLVAGARVVSSDFLSDFARAADGDPLTLWESAAPAPVALTVDLGALRTFNRWRVRHYSANEKLPAPDATVSAGAERNTADFKLQTSRDSRRWQDVDAVTDNTAGVTHRFIRPVTARYARLLITKANHTGDGTVRLYEFAVHAAP
ncbi:MAG TPA: cellulase family glycosylhydrolase [Opitutaceae bacterium]